MYSKLFVIRNRCLALPMYPTLTEEEQDYVIEKVKEFIG